MEKEKFQNLLQYQTIMGWVHDLMNDGIITKAEYAKINTKMPKNYGLSSDSIFRLSA